MAGWSTTPFSPLLPAGQNLGGANGHTIIFGFGEFYSGRFAQVRGTWRLPDKLGDFAVAIVDPKGGPAYGGANESMIPRIEAALALRLGNFNLYPGAFYQKSEYEIPGDDSLTVWGTSLGVRTSFGPFQLDAEVNYGENFGNTLGAFQAGGAQGVSYGIPGAVGNLASAHRVGTTFEDTDALLYWAQLSFKLGPATINGVFGQARYENDLTDTDVRTTAYGISVPITMAKGFIVRPELFRYDYGDGSRGQVGGVEQDFGTEIIGGVQFQITF
jgi:hypothetical protein